MGERDLRDRIEYGVPDVLGADQARFANKQVLLIGSGAEEFAQGQGIEMVDPKYFHDERRWKQLERAREKNEQALDNSLPEAEDDLKFGTVGAVALDLNGNLAAGTSWRTAGSTSKYSAGLNPNIDATTLLGKLSHLLR